MKTSFIPGVEKYHNTGLFEGRIVNFECLSVAPLARSERKEEEMNLIMHFITHIERSASERNDGRSFPRAILL